MYCNTPSARIDRLIPIWKQPFGSRLHTAASREKEPPSHSRLHTVVSWGNKCLSDTYLETAVWRPPPHGRLMVYRTTASQPPASGRLAAAGTAVSQPFPNGCLAVNSSRTCLAGGTILAMYILHLCQDSFHVSIPACNVCQGWLPTKCIWGYQGLFNSCVLHCRSIQIQNGSSKSSFWVCGPNLNYQ